MFLFPDVQATVIAWLPDQLESVYGRGKPAVGGRGFAATGSFVRVMRTGGHKTSPATEAAQVTFECWAASDTEAEELARYVEAFTFSLQGATVNGVQVGRVNEVAGLGNLPALQGQARYVQTFEIHVRGSAT